MKWRDSGAVLPKRMGREPRARIGHVRSHAARVLAITMLFAVNAHADKIDDLNSDLDNDSDRVRLTAVLALTNQQSPRSIPGLVKRMLDSGEKKNIRGLAANALGEIVSKGSPNPGQKKAAIDALTKAKNDPEPFVSAKADAALANAGAGGGGGATPTAPGSYLGVYVNVGPFSAKDPAHKAAMKKTAESKLSQLQSSWVQTWAGGAQPTAAQLAQKKFAGFYIDGTLDSVTVNKSGSTATVTCKVNAYLAEFPSRNIIAPGNGSANVQGGTSARDIELGTQDCVQAVIESLITKRIVPTIKSKI